MTDTQKDILFDRFLKGQLDEAEQESFLAMLRENPDWQDEVQTRRVALLIGDRLAEKELSQKFEDWDADLEKIRKKKAFGLKFLGLLLILALLFFAVTQLRNKPKLEAPPPPVKPMPDTSQQHPQAQNPTDSLSTKKPNHRPSKPGPDIIIALSARKALAIAEMDIKRNSAPYRNEGNFTRPRARIDSLLSAKAFSAANPLISALPDASEKLRYKAYALFYQGRYEEAVNAFRAWELQSDDAQTANWFILLCCICSKETPDENCVELLKNTASDASNPYSIEASNFLKK